MGLMTGRRAGSIAVAIALSVSTPASAVDAGDGSAGKNSAPVAVDGDAAENLARREGCLKCHGVEKDKEGPSFKKVSGKFRGKPEAEAQVLKHLRTGPLVKFSDGEEEEHRIIRSKDEGAVMNLIRWILSR